MDKIKKDPEDNEIKRERIENILSDLFKRAGPQGLIGNYRQYRPEGA